MQKVYLSIKEIQFLKTVCNMLEDTLTMDNINITPYHIAKCSGVSYNTIRKNIKTLKDL
jgi:hypothetical protein